MPAVAHAAAVSLGGTGSAIGAVAVTRCVRQPSCKPVARSHRNEGGFARAHVEGVGHPRNEVAANRAPQIGKQVFAPR
jgi:hypothetical protein